MTGRLVDVAGAEVWGERVDPARGRRTPLSENAVIGAATGRAMAGRPVVVELVDIVGVARAWDALADAGTVVARSKGGWTVPLAVRVPLAAKDAVPAVPDGVAVRVVGRWSRLGPVMKEAIAAGVPTVVFEAASAVDGADPVLPSGGDVVVLASGEGVAVAVAAAEALAGEVAVGVVEVEGTGVDGTAIRASGRVVAVGHGAEGWWGRAVSAAFWSLEAPPVEVRADAGVDAVIAAIRSTFEE